MCLTCSACVCAGDAPTQRPLKQFRAPGHNDKDIVLQGMDRVCDACWARGQNILGTNQMQVVWAWCKKTPAKDGGSCCKACVQIRIKCTACSAAKKRHVQHVVTAFDPVLMQRVRAQRSMPRAIAAQLAQLRSMQHASAAACLVPARASQQQIGWRSGRAAWRRFSVHSA